MDSDDSIAAPRTGKICQMAGLITQDKLREFVTEGKVIGGGDTACVEGIKYDFRFGTQFLKAALERPVDYRDLKGTERTQAKIEPGEVVFVMSEEKLHLPMDIFVQLIHKRKLSHDGIAIMGGLCVDPGYEGHLLVGLHNFSSSPFQIQPGHKLIAGLFFQLSAQEQGNFPAPSTKITEFPEQLVKLIGSYQPINLGALNDQITLVRNDVMLIQRELSEDRTWRNEFKKDLGDLLKALQEEKENRQEQYKEISGKISSIEKNQVASSSKEEIWDKGKWLLLGAGVSLIVGVILKYIFH